MSKQEEVKNVEENVVDKKAKLKAELKETKMKLKEEKRQEKLAKKEEKKKNREEKKAMKKAIKMNESKIIIGIVIFVLLIAFGIFGVYFYKSNFEVIAKFNGGKITKAEYDVYYKTFAEILSQYYGYPDSMIPEEIANKAAIDKVIVGFAEEAGTQISDEDQATLDEIFNNEEYIQSFVSQGMDIDRARKLYYNDYLITQYLSDLQENASDEEILKYIKEQNGEDVDLYEYNTSHILFKTVDDSNNSLSDEEKANAKSKANAVLARVLAGEDFATLAKENSEDTGTAENGGEYICYSDGSTVDEYIKAVKTLEVGKTTTTLVETSYGYHIIKLNSKVENGRANSAADREQYVNNFTDGLQENYAVEINNEVLNNYIISVTGSPIPTDETTEEDSTTEGEVTEEQTQE